MAGFAILQGVDYSFDHPTPGQLRVAGKKFAVRYVYPLSQNPGTKNLTRAEANALKDAGIAVVSNYESYAGRAQDGRGAGAADAVAADKQHKACGGPGARPIFFSVDFDTTSADYARVDSYFRGVASVLGVARTGVYGEYDLCKHLIDAGLIGKSASPGKFYAWQTYAWSAGKYDERCCLAQDKNGVKLGSGTVDLDSAHCADYGQWGFKAPAAKPPAKKPPAKPPMTATLRIDVMHISMQYSDTTAQQRADSDKVFARARTRKIWWVTGTEANNAEDRANISSGAAKYGFRFIHKGGDVWIAIDPARIAGNLKSDFTKVIQGVAGRYPTRGVLRATFDPKLPVGQLTILAAHYNLGPPGHPHGTGPVDNPLIAKEIGRQAKVYGKGSGLVFYGGDQNIHDNKFDSFYGEPLTSTWDELRHYAPTHPGPETIDVIASYDPDGRVKAAYSRSQNDATFHLNTDHFLVEAGFDITLLKPAKKGK